MKTILIVDDCRTIRQLICNALRELNYTLIEAENGHEALTWLATKTPDAVITDIHMPVIDGIRLVEAIRDNCRLKLLPVLILTTEQDQQFKERARRAGATAWLTKPFQDDLLAQGIKHLLN